ncbi:uncharacterized protein LOC116512145 isoform X2 [Thamnophis elegans]|nr:uncharacterized protein LOC116512145 isoform X2 [Thamnophis elegans]XP_032078384.1 uncharacterized protein LOC116512145 isoform X2 [Thamnophis elegans]
MATCFGLRLRKLPRYVRVNFQESSSVQRLHFFFSLWACLSSAPGNAEALNVSMPAQKTAILGTNVTLQCNISDYPPPELDITKTIFIWYLETPEGNKEEKLYSVVDGKHSSNRYGSRLDTIQLKNGDASLFLPQIQFNEEGKYKCVVIDTSVRAEGATILDLVVEPTVQLSPKELEIENGNVKTLRCRVNKFYPDSIVILWQKHSKHTSDKDIPVDDIFMETSVRNGDGTYNTTSKLRLQPSSQDHGNVYSCIVQHKSFARFPVYNVTLTVTEPYSTTPLTIGLVLCFLISFLLVGLLLYIVFLKKLDPPSVEMFGIEELNHLEETQLQCLISHFRPKPLQVDLFLVTEPQKTKQKIAFWPRTSVEEPTEDAENSPLLGNLKDMFKTYPVLKSKPKNYFDLQWKICMNPDVQKLEKFQLLLDIKYEDFQHGLCKTKSFKVIALPELHDIHCSTNMPRSNEPLTLSCNIHSYFPDTLEVYWTNDDGIVDSSFSTPPTKGTNGLYFCISKIHYCPQVEDSGKRFVCRAKLQGPQAYKESVWRMNPVVVAPKVDKIECKPPVPECGKPITLRCLLTEYHPPECDIHWKKGSEELLGAEVKTGEPQLDRMSMLYSRASEITFTPSAEDHELEFFVEINHCKEIVRKVYKVMLKDFPKLSNIVIEPSDAGYGQSVTLTCDVTDFNPKKIGTQWLLGDNSPTNAAVTEDLDKACNGCYKLTSVFKLRATASVCDKAIFFRVNHATLTKPITREVNLKLPEALKVSMPTQKTAILGTNVTLQCKISDYPPPELDIKKTIFIWYLETSEGNKVEQLYSVVAGKHSSNRNGSRLDTIQLKNGDASLFLPLIQFNEEGKYLCVVIDTSVRAEGATILDLVVEPTVQLSPKELEIENGNVKTLRCRVNKFYPDSIVILWQKHSKHTSDKDIPVGDIFMRRSVRNGDGTYNTTSILRVQPSSQDQGNVYSCIVQHKSFARYPVYNVTLTVTEPYSTTQLTIGLVLCFLILFLLAGLLRYIVFLKKYAPSVEMVGSEELKHLEETQLQCLISHFRPKPLQVDLFLVTELQKTKQKIASWHTTSLEEPTEDDENSPLLGNLEDMFKAYPELKSKPKNYYDFQWKICLNPDVQKLEEFQLLLEIKHEGFQHGLCTKTKSFKVVALPVLHEIHCSTNVPRPNEPLSLSCTIHSYFPETLEVCWNNDDGILDSSFSTPPTKGTDGLYFCISKIHYCPQVEDYGKRLVCRAKLEGSKTYKESTWQMNTMDYKIECKPPVPECGKPITLSCSLTKYHPPECDIYWRKGFEELTDATIKTEEPQLDRMSKLYSRTSEITFTPSAEDHELEFFVEINHCKKIVREGYKVMLKDFPKLSNIVIEPSDADYGQSVTLTCDVTDFNPKKIGTQWLLGDNSLTNGVVTEDLDILCYGCYKLTSVFELRATASVCNKAICFKVNHEKLTKPITREVYLKLPDFSDLEET